eukprot:762157-Pleurochrysis_carterae.AAC.1
MPTPLVIVTVPPSARVGAYAFVCVYAHVSSCKRETRVKQEDWGKAAREKEEQRGGRQFERWDDKARVKVGRDKGKVSIKKREKANVKEMAKKKEKRRKERRKRRRAKVGGREEEREGRRKRKRKRVRMRDREEDSCALERASVCKNIFCFLDIQGRKLTPPDSAHVARSCLTPILTDSA